MRASLVLLVLLYVLLSSIGFTNKLISRVRRRYATIDSSIQEQKAKTLIAQEDNQARYEMFQITKGNVPRPYLPAILQKSVEKEEYTSI